MKSMGRIYRCTIEGCNRSTVTPLSRDPRKRWVIDLHMVDDEGCMACDAAKQGIASDLTHTCIIRIVSMCPACAANLLHLTEEHYQRLEKAEQIAAGKRPASELVQ